MVVDPNDLDNANKDSDCDGLSDAEEFGNTYAGGKRTDPANPDTDGDGIKDGIEAGRAMSVNTTCGYVGDADPATRTLPTEPDSDSDGIPDGTEDTNKNGRSDTGETDATNPDSDFDSLPDGVEDANKNGMVDAGETDPRKKDTDGDFINDGVELATTKTDPTKADTDGDTCVDGAEDFDQDGTVDMGETDPKNAGDCGPANNPDSDNDGLPNRIEDRNNNGVVDPDESDPNNPDTDGDGLKDGVEDRNKNGLYDPGETNFRKKDTDCDGLIDGPNQGAFLGEDLNSDGMLNGNETDPTKFDTDGDGISDGVERGITSAALADPTGCLNVPVDADPTTTTDPTRRDSDGDGIDDGAEDSNQNGKVDLPFELDPNNGMDGTGPAGQVCTQNNLRPVLFRADGEPDIQLGLPNSFTEVTPMVSGGQKRGFIGYDPTNRVAFVAWRQAAPTGATNPTQDEAALVTRLGMVGAITLPTTQTYTSWDGIASLQAFYNMAGTTELKARANAIAENLVGAGAGALMGNSPVNGPFQLQVQYLHRSNTAVVVVVALTPLTNYSNTPLFVMSDTAGGSAIAQFGDANAYQCERFSPTSGKVDFVFVVDDSCSMAGSQTALGNAATAMANALNNSTLDWRVALVGSSYAIPGRGGYTKHRRGFVARDDANAVATFRGWLTANAGCTNSNTQCGAGQACFSVDGGWIGICAGGSEATLGSVRSFINDITPGSDAGTSIADRARADAQLVVVLLGDADDQTATYNPATNQITVNDSCGGTGCEPEADFQSFFSGGQGDGGLATRNKTGMRIPLHTIVCPDTGAACNGEYRRLPNQRHASVTTATGAIRGAINDNASIDTSMTAIVNSTIAAAGYRMQKPPIGASVKVALSTVLNPAMCNANDLPRSRANGFDFDGINRTISLYGACRPASTTTQAAVSYRYWVDTTPNPSGNPPPCFGDPFYDAGEADFCRGKLTCNLTANVCECPANCGGNAPAGKVCNPNKFVCDFVCTSDCGGTCNGYQVCNTQACGCECVQTASCAVGYKFQNGAGVCGCVCDTASLNCGSTYDADATSCSCVCKPNCGGCPSGQTCNPSTCSCGGGVN